MRSVLSGALVAAAAAAPLFAQLGPRATVALEPPALTRGQTAILRVQVDIPDGYYVPAETNGPIKGAWFQVVEPGFDARAFPTYPTPVPVHVGQAIGSLLAYSGGITIAVPVDVASVAGRRTLRGRFGYQLCDAKQCGEFVMQPVSAQVEVKEPAAAAMSLAFRIDRSRVGIFREQRLILPSDSVDFVSRPLAMYAVPLLAVPEPQLSSGVQADGHRVWSRWYLASNGRSYSVIVEDLAGFAAECFKPDGADTHLVLVARSLESSFATEPARYFLASPTPRSASPSASIDLRLSASQRVGLEMTIDRQMRITVPSLFAPDPHIQDRRPLHEETPYDRQVRAGRGRLSYSFEAFRLAPDGAPRLFVRASWAIGRESKIGLTMWIRMDDDAFVVEQTDAWASAFARYGEAKEMGHDLAARPEIAGQLLNVVPREDGRAYVIMGRRGYEGATVTVSNYSPFGPISIEPKYGYGC